MVDSPIIILPGNNESKTIDHKPSLSFFTNLVNTSINKHCFKLAELTIFTDSKDGVPDKHWLAKIDKKITANKNLMNTLKSCMVYVINCMSGMAFSYLEPHV